MSRLKINYKGLLIIAVILLMVGLGINSYYDDNYVYTNSQLRPTAEQSGTSNRFTSEKAVAYAQLFINKEIKNDLLYPQTYTVVNTDFVGVESSDKLVFKQKLYEVSPRGDTSYHEYEIKTKPFTPPQRITPDATHAPGVEIIDIRKIN